MSSGKLDFSHDNTSTGPSQLFLSWPASVKQITQYRSLLERGKRYTSQSVCVCVCIQFWTVGSLEAEKRRYLTSLVESPSSGWNSVHKLFEYGSFQPNTSLIALACVCFCLISWRQSHAKQNRVFVLKWPFGCLNGNAYLSRMGFCTNKDVFKDFDTKLFIRFLAQRISAGMRKFCRLTQKFALHWFPRPKTYELNPWLLKDLRKNKICD